MAISIVDQRSASQTTESPDKRDRYYDPPAIIKSVPGVSVEEYDHCDEYHGKAEALASAGLLPLASFPGQAGQPTSSVSWRPKTREPGRSICSQAGYMQVFRKLNGTFRIRLNVSAEAREARQVVREQRERAAEEAAEEVLKELPTGLREYCETIVQMYGRRGAKMHFSDPEFLARNNIRSSVANQILRGLEVLHLACIERDLARASSVADGGLLLARDLLARVFQQTHPSETRHG